MALFCQSLGSKEQCEKCLQYTGAACILKIFPTCGYFNVVKYCKDGLNQNDWFCPERFIRYNDELKRLIESGEASPDKICTLLEECQ
ncbi:hypothetical protein Ddc_17766 [Ditylenchus destructor]|nr:hypothetical protein Ddc_17766 [Ditylenchus destructor]